MEADDPGRVRVISVHPERRPCYRAGLSVRVRLRRADPEPASALPHEIRHVPLWRLARFEPSEMGVLWCRYDPSSAVGRDRDACSPRGAVPTRDLRGPEPAASVTGQNLITDTNVLDRLLRSVRHRDESSRNHALIRIADGADVVMLLGEQLQQSVLRVVRVLVLVDEDVAERLLPLLAHVGETFEHVDGEHE